MMTVEEARARKAELIRQVREGTPPLWNPKPGWADTFTDDDIWEAWREVAREDKLSTDDSSTRKSRAARGVSRETPVTEE